MIRLVLRDLVAAALAKQVVPVTVTQLASVLDEFGCGDYRLIGRALRQLEARGLAEREHDTRPQWGRPADLWQPVTPTSADVQSG